MGHDDRPIIDLAPQLEEFVFGRLGYAHDPVRRVDVVAHGQVHWSVSEPFRMPFGDQVVYRHHALRPRYQVEVLRPVVGGVDQVGVQCAGRSAGTPALRHLRCPVGQGVGPERQRPHLRCNRQQVAVAAAAQRDLSVHLEFRVFPVAAQQFGEVAGDAAAAVHQEGLVVHQHRGATDACAARHGSTLVVDGDAVGCA